MMTERRAAIHAIWEVNVELLDAAAVCSAEKLDKHEWHTAQDFIKSNQNAVEYRGQILKVWNDLWALLRNWIEQICFVS